MPSNSPVSTLHPFLKEGVSFSRMNLTNHNQEYLYSVFFKTIRSIGKVPVPVIDQLFAQIVEAYTGRDYHNLTHITYMIKWSEYYGKLIELDNLPYVLLSIFYHDFHYSISAKPGENEERSWQQAETTLKIIEEACGITIPQAKYQFVKGSILTTKHKKAPDHGQLALVHDLDFLILAVTEWELLKYEGNIRKEYAIYDDATYKKGRAEFLESTLSKPIFYHRVISEQHEKTAQDNIKFLIRHIS